MAAFETVVRPRSATVAALRTSKSAKILSKKLDSKCHYEPTPHGLRD